MKERKDKSRIPILAAGGIVLRNGPSLQFAVVQSRKTGTWGLPKGKLAVGEDAMTAARREVLEETGYSAAIHEFLGTLAYEASGRPKVVQFWRMEAAGDPVGDLMRDVRAVRWLALEDAIDQLTHLREQVFLDQVGPIALQFAEPARRALSQGRSAGNIGAGKIIVPGVPFAAAGDAGLPGQAEPQDYVASLLPATDALAPAGEAAHAEGTETVEKPLAALSRKTLVRKTWGWFRNAAMLHREMD